MTKCTLKEQERAEILLNAGSAGSVALSHVLECDSCAEAVAQQSALWARLDTWTMPELSSGFNRELYAKIDAVMSEPWYERWAASIKSAFARPSLAIGTAVLIVVGFTLDHSVSKAPQMGTAKMSTSEAEQMEKTLDDMEMLRQFDLSVEEKETTSKSM